MNRMQLHYLQTVKYDLINKGFYKNVHQIPKLQKIILTSMSKDVLLDKKKILPIILGLELIAGQKPIITKAKKSVATFKLRNSK